MPAKSDDRTKRMILRRERVRLFPIFTLVCLAVRWFGTLPLWVGRILKERDIPSRSDRKKPRYIGGSVHLLFCYCSRRPLLFPRPLIKRLPYLSARCIIRYTRLRGAGRFAHRAGIRAIDIAASHRDETWN